MVYDCYKLLLFIVFFYVCNCYKVDFNSNRIIYRNNFNDSLVIHCTLLDKNEDLSPSKITIIREKKSSLENYISVLNDSTIQLKINNVQQSHSGLYMCVKKSDFKRIAGNQVKILVGDKPSVPDLQVHWIDNKNISATFEPSIGQIQRETNIDSNYAKINLTFSYLPSSQTQENSKWIYCDETPSPSSSCVMHDSGFYLTKSYTAQRTTSFSFYVTVNFGGDLLPLFGISERIWVFNYTDILQPSAVPQSEVSIDRFPRNILLHLPSAADNWLDVFKYRYQVIWFTLEGLKVGDAESIGKTSFNLNELHPNTCYKVNITRSFFHVKTRYLYRQSSFILSIQLCSAMTVPGGSVSWPSFWWRLSEQLLEMWWVPLANSDWFGDNAYYRVEYFANKVLLAGCNSTMTYCSVSSNKSQQTPTAIMLQACNSVGCSPNLTRQLLPQYDKKLSDHWLEFDVEKIPTNSISQKQNFAIVIFFKLNSIEQQQLNISGFILLRNTSHYVVVDQKFVLVNSSIANVGTVQLNMSYVQLKPPFSSDHQFFASMTLITPTGDFNSTGLLNFSKCVYGDSPSSEKIQEALVTQKVDCARDKCDVLFKFRRLTCEEYSIARVTHYEVQYEVIDSPMYSARSVRFNSMDFCRFNSDKNCELPVALKKNTKYRFKIVAHLSNTKSLTYSNWNNVSTIVSEDDTKLALIVGCVLFVLILLLVLAIVIFHRRKNIKQIFEHPHLIDLPYEGFKDWHLRIENTPKEPFFSSSSDIYEERPYVTSSSGLGSSIDSSNPMETIASLSVSGKSCDVITSSISAEFDSCRTPAAKMNIGDYAFDFPDANITTYTSYLQ